MEVGYGVIISRNTYLRRTAVRIQGNEDLTQFAKSVLDMMSDFGIYMHNISGDLEELPETHPELFFEYVGMPDMKGDLTRLRLCGRGSFFIGKIKTYEEITQNLARPFSLAERQTIDKELAFWSDIPADFYFARELHGSNEIEL
jgi:hypothetical protein